MGEHELAPEAVVQPVNGLPGEVRQEDGSARRILALLDEEAETERGLAEMLLGRSRRYEFPEWRQEADRIGGLAHEVLAEALRRIAGRLRNEMGIYLTPSAPPELPGLDARRTMGTDTGL